VAGKPDVAALCEDVFPKREYTDEERADLAWRYSVDQRALDRPAAAFKRYADQTKKPRG
jgi:hypothetical protein